MFSVLVNPSCSTWWAPNCRQNQLVLVLLQLSMQNPLMLNSQCNAAAALQPLTWSHFHGDNVSQPACVDLKKKQTRAAASLNLPLPVNNSSVFQLTDQYHISYFVLYFCSWHFLEMFYIITWSSFFKEQYLSLQAIIQAGSKKTTTFNSLLWTSLCSESIRSLLAGVDLMDSSSAAGADDFDPITRNPTSQQVTVATVTVPGAPGGEGDVTGDHVTRADSPYIVTLKASDKRAGAV